jgi:hypothetical protein
MNEVYIDMRKENEWIKKHFNADFVSIDQLISCIENLDSEIEHLKENQEDIEKVREFYEKREKELLSRVKEWY